MNRTRFAPAALMCALLLGCAQEQKDPEIVVRPNNGGAHSAAGGSSNAAMAGGGAGGSTSLTAGGSAGVNAGGSAGVNAGAAGCAVQGQVANAQNSFMCSCPSHLPDQCPDVGCVNLMADARHCGDCSVDCDPGSACNAGACTPVPTEVGTLDGCTSPRMILSNGTFYFADTGTGTISSMAVGGGAAVSLATDQMMPAVIAADADGVYWSNWGDNTISKVARSGGAPEVMITLDEPARGLAVGNGKVFFTHAADIFKIPTAGVGDAGAGVPPPPITCRPLELASGRIPPPEGEPVPGATYVASSNDSCSAGGKPSVLALNNDRLSYFADVRFKLDDNLQTGGDYFKLGAGPSGVLDPMVMDATHAFWASEDAVQRGALGIDYMVDFVANTEEHDAVTGLTITSTHVYIASEHGNISRSSMMATDPIVNEPLARDQITPKWLVHDDANLYWIGTDCRIMSIALPP